MEKIVDKYGKFVLKRTDFMNWIAISSYHRVAIMAIVNNVNLDKAYEQAISEFMQALYKSRPLHRKQILELLAETGIEGITTHAFDHAAKLILNSHIPEKIM